MRVSQIKNGTVSEIHEINRPIADFPDAGYVEVPDHVTGEYTYDGQNFLPPEAYPDLKSARMVMVDYINAKTKQITDDYPASEVASWGSKAEAARAVGTGNARADQTAMIQDEADITGRTMAEQATSILGKAVIFEEIIAKASGLRQVTEIALAEATTSDEREAILDAAIAQAEAILAPFGIT